MRKSALVGIVAMLLAAPVAPAEDETVTEVGGFSTLSAGGELPEGWEPLEFPRIEKHTSYRLVSVEGRTVVRAESLGSASGMIRRTNVDLAELPFLEWSWKVSNVLERGDVRTREGDDYAARIYVTFAVPIDELGFFERAKFEAARLLYGEYPPVAALNYVWANRAENELVVPNAFTERAMMVVVETGTEKVGEWVYEVRNVAEDYRRAFGGDPPPVSGVAIMTDTDNTGESATAFYGDIRFQASKPEPETPSPEASSQP